MNAEFKHKLIRYGFISLVFLLFILMFWPFLTSLLLAALFAAATNDFVKRLTQKKISQAWATIIVILMGLVFIAVPAVILTLKTMNTIKVTMHDGLSNSALYQSTEQLLHEITDYTTSLAQDFGIDLSRFPKPVELLGEYSGEIGSYATSALTRLPQAGLGIIVFLLGFYYFLNESKRIRKFFLSFDLLSEPELGQIVAIIKRSSYLTLIASLIIGSLQALTVTVFAYFCGFSDFFIVFILSFLFSLIPVVGSAPISLFLSAICFIQGANTEGFAMLLALGIAASIDNLIKTYIFNSENKDLHPIVSLLSLIGAILVYGPIGILLGPVLTQLAFSILPILTTNAAKSGEFQPDSDL